MKKTIALLAVLIVILSLVCLSWADKGKNEVKPQLPAVQRQPAVTLPAGGQSLVAAFEIPWSSINGGGDVTMSSTNYKAKVTTGQSVIGESQSTNYQMGIGFWYGVPTACVSRGNVNGDQIIDVVDIVCLIQEVFFQNCAYTPAEAGNVNCDANTDVVDIVALIGFVFYGEPKPCCL